MIRTEGTIIGILEEGGLGWQNQVWARGWTLLLGRLWKEGREHGIEHHCFCRLGVGTNIKELLPDCLIFLYEIGVRSYLESEEVLS